MTPLFDNTSLTARPIRLGRALAGALAVGLGILAMEVLFFAAVFW